MKIRRIEIHNYRGIEERAVDVSPHGAIAKGRNGGGKTTLLKAVHAALLARDVGPDAIRHGADRAEILVDTDDVSVRRVITAKGQRLDVQRDGMAAKSPQTFLTELLGTSSLDPMDLLTLRGKERRAKVLSALPVTVTVEQLRQWVPTLKEDYDCSGHGLEVIGKLRAQAYERRTEANKTAKTARDEANRAVAAVGAPVDGAPSLADTQAVLARCEAAKARLEARADEARKAEARTADIRTRVARLRADAKATLAAIEREVPAFELDAAKLKLSEATEARKAAEEALRKAIAAEESASDDLADLEDQARQHQSAFNKAKALETQAAELESAISAAAVPAPEQAELDAAAQALAQARAALDQAQAAEAWRTRKAKADECLAKATEAEAEADRLDAMVHALTNDAPAALLAASDGIPGLSLDGDEILLDGVRLDALCGAEQVRFCVEVARRANSKSRILVVDGLERLDPEQFDVFVREATRDDYQLLATRVDRGDVVIEAIEPELEAAAAE